MGVVVPKSGFEERLGELLAERDRVLAAYDGRIAEARFWLEQVTQADEIVATAEAESTPVPKRKRRRA